MAEGARDSGSDVRDVSDEYALLAVQGPRAIERLGLPDAAPFTFAEGEIDGILAWSTAPATPASEAVELLTHGRGRAPRSGTRARARRRAVRARRARHAAARGLLPAARQRHHARHGRRSPPGSAGCCALDKEFTGVDVIRRVKEARAGAEARPVRDGGARRSRGRAWRSTGGGEVTSGTHSPMLERRDRHGLRAGAARRARYRAHDRRARAAAAGAS